MLLFSGQTAPMTASYEVIGANGELIGTLNINAGDILPPTLSNETYFSLN